jgi:hypothetical protein
MTPTDRARLLGHRCQRWAFAIDSGGPLPLSERVRHAEAARRAHMHHRLLASAKARGVSRRGVASG